MSYLSDSDREYYLEPPVSKADWSYKHRTIQTKRDNLQRAYIAHKNQFGQYAAHSDGYFDRYQELSSLCEEWYALYDTSDFYDALPEN